MQCFDTFNAFLHKLYAATMERKGREGTYNFSHDDWEQPGRGGQGSYPLCHPAGAAHGTTTHTKMTAHQKSVKIANRTRRPTAGCNR